MTRLLALSFPCEVAIRRRALNAGSAVAVFAALGMGATAAQAQQLPQTFVSVSGVDSATCGRTAPCKTFAGALAKTKVNGEVICLDKGNFHTATIKMSVSIDCHDARGSILQIADAGGVIDHGIVIDFASFDAGDVRKTVNLRGLNVQGLDGGVDGILITDFTGSLPGPPGFPGPVPGATGGLVFIEDCVINGEFGSIDGRGISDTRSHGGALSISDTTVRNMGRAGISILPVRAGPTINVTIDNSRVQNAKFGLAAGKGAKVLVNRSVFSENSSAGIEADPAAEVDVNDSVSVHNGTGVESSGTVWLSNSNISFNDHGVAGSISSYRNNRFSDNKDLGVTITPATPGLQ
jgi:hypothetical protein